MSVRTAYYIEFANDRVGGIVYRHDLIRKFVRDDPVRSVHEVRTEWFGDHDKGTRGFRETYRRELTPSER